MHSGAMKENLNNHFCLVLPLMFKKTTEYKQKWFSFEAGASETKHICYDNAANIFRCPI